VKSVPTAVNCTVPLGATVAGFGETTSVDNVPGSVLSFLQAVADRPANATAMMIRAVREICVRTFRLFLNLFMNSPEACKREWARSRRGPERKGGIDWTTCLSGEFNGSNGFGRIGAKRPFRRAIRPGLMPDGSDQAYWM
jgi:hypothetical protein